MTSAVSRFRRASRRQMGKTASSLASHSLDTAPRGAAETRSCPTHMKKVFLFLLMALALSASALTLHRSFTHREAGFGFGTGSATVSVPIDRRAATALDEAREAARAKELERRKARRLADRKKRDARVLVIGSETNEVRYLYFGNQTNAVDRVVEKPRARSKPTR